MFRLLKRPSGFIPPAMSLFVMLLIVIHIVRFGIDRQADEGTEAHLFQILLPAQLPIIAFFAIMWLPRNRNQALAVLAVQLAVALAVVGTVFLLDW